MKITKTAVDRLEAPAKGYALHWDDKLAGFGVRVTPSGIKSFICQHRIKDKDRRLTLGRYGPLTVEQARKQAAKLLGQIATGRDPVAEKAQARLESVTLAEAFEAYLAARKSLKPLTVADMRRAMKGLSDWHSKPLTGISREMVVKRHKKLAERSQARANLTMRYLRAVFNFAAAQYTDANGKPIIADNPVKRLSDTRAWYRVERRQTIVKPHQLRPWMQAVMALEDDPAAGRAFETVRDFLLAVLLTGLRRNEAQTLRWEQVDLDGRTLTVTDTKNRKDHTLPLSDYLADMLSGRERVNEYVFPGNRSHLQEPRRAMRVVTEQSGVAFTVHDLRRTFATVADSLDIPGYAVKALLNHKNAADVTAGYVVSDVERLRGPMQKITDYMLRAGGVRKSAEVVELRQAPETEA